MLTLGGYSSRGRKNIRYRKEKNKQRGGGKSRKEERSVRAEAVHTTRMGIFANKRLIKLV